MSVSLKQVGMLVLGLICGVLIVSFFLSVFEPREAVVDGRYPELSTLEEMFKSGAKHDDYETYFQALAEEKGAVYAFNVMKVSPLPHGLDTHLLGHAIGDILYLQKGVDGMAYCTHDFRNACSHTIVIGALLEHGTNANEQIQSACQQAPGGTGAYTMCFHGLGHGVLAFNEYEMEKTAEMCRTLGTDAYNHKEADQCFGGAVMEIISGGGHDKEAWDERRAEYLVPESPLSLCDAAYLTPGERDYCYTYITPYLIEAVNGSVGLPSEDDWEGVFEICETVSTDEPLLRENCFGGAGKEFIGIVAGRDFRNGINISPEGYRTMHDWCHLTDDMDGVAACQRSVTGSLYWGGENPLAVPLAFCAASPDPTSENVCYEALMHNISLYVSDEGYRRNACNTLPNAFMDRCEAKLLNIGTL